MVQVKISMTRSENNQIESNGADSAKQINEITLDRTHNISAENIGYSIDALLRKI